MNNRELQKSQSGGVNIDGGTVASGRDVIGRDQIIQNITAASEKLTALHQLQPPPADFTGRTDEMAGLLEAVSVGKTNIIGIRGLGGVGKTTLALKLAGEVKDLYPDGQFQVDLRGMSKELLPPKEAMAQVIRAYDRRAQMPESEAEIAGLYRSVLHGKRALLLMDNAGTARQVEILIPPSTCLLLLTSRLHFAVPGLVEKNLDALTPQEAEALLLRIAPRLAQAGGECTSHLAQLCGYLPLALRTAGSALQVKRGLEPADYVRRLQDASKRLSEFNEVEMSLEVSYELLSERLCKSLRYLGVFPESWDVAAAAFTWQVETDLAQEELETLLLYSLIDFNEATRRYRLHDLVRLSVDAHSSLEEREAARQLHAGHYLHILTDANKLYLERGLSILEGLAVFDTEWQNIRAGQAWAAERAKIDKVASEWCSEYPVRGADCLSLRQHPRDRISWLEAALDAARQLKSRKQEGAILGYLGLAYDSLGEYRRAIEYHEQHLKIAVEIGDRSGEGRALGSLGIAYHALGDYERASKYHEKDLEVAREINDRRSEATASGNLGIAYLRLGDYRRAIEYQEHRLRITREIGDQHGEGNAFGNLGNAYDALQQYDRALECYDQRLRIATALRDRLGEANGLWNSSNTLYVLGNRAEAIVRAEEALKIFEQIEDPDAPDIRNQLTKWREEEKSAARLPQ